MRKDYEIKLNFAFDKLTWRKYLRIRFAIWIINAFLSPIIVVEEAKKK